MKRVGWTIKEEIDGTTWWMIRGGAFTDVINQKYPLRFFESKEEAEIYSANINRRLNKKTKVVETLTTITYKVHEEEDEKETK